MKDTIKPLLNKQQINDRNWTIFLLIFYFPLGLPLMWIVRPFSKRTRWIISLSFLGAILLGFIMIIVWTTSPSYLY